MNSSIIKEVTRQNKSTACQPRQDLWYVCHLILSPREPSEGIVMASLWWMRFGFWRNWLMMLTQLKEVKRRQIQVHLSLQIFHSSLTRRWSSSVCVILKAMRISEPLTSFLSHHSGLGHHGGIPSVYSVTDPRARPCGYWIACFRSSLVAKIKQSVEETS